MRQKFRKDFTPEQYERYLENCAKTTKFEHDGLESWEIQEGVKEGTPTTQEQTYRNYDRVSYCFCKKPVPNPFGMDNLCARCGLVINSSLSKKETGVK